MKHLAALLIALPLSAFAQDLPPGVASARLLPGWMDQDGSRVTALELNLKPGWKTYWKSPGETGIPPVFDWASTIQAEYLWPAPEIIDSGGERTLGFHDALILPIRLQGAGDGPLTTSVDLGVCEDICVPVHLELTTGAAGQSDPLILAALDRAPEAAEGLTCQITPAADGLAISASLPSDMIAESAAFTTDDTGIWISTADLAQDGGTAIAKAEMLDATGKPFDLDPAQVTLTLIAPDRSIEARC
ncbi:MAG: protein-disulfide reductase DsbD family protein [Paracoccus sp. (in: a-proteobacteria)]|uniref:protein-disulfide reductase DsbD domain-containing protein n=1 Tax=Paracoccus sp. TaxID=267 RepID=UPI0026DF370A|nr:protein-disulfide reductase DsbD domain-containing protein [Paracoccus sp. (in: a-proteobacteria)]MDO5621460.1 protein-disulfide reductase DsbD family protein [Paracoccus sp. (in: a-proteobacteria)]